MKIQLDTTNKTVRLESNVNLAEFYQIIMNMLPNDLWKEFTLQTNANIVWNTPIIWRDIYQPVNPWWPRPWVTYNVGDNTTQQGFKYELKSGTYNIEA